MIDTRGKNDEHSMDEPKQKKRKIVINEKESADSPATFDGSQFRKLIKGEHPLGGVRQLLSVARNTDESVIKDYLNCGGSALEIVLVIDKLQNKTYYHHYIPVFSVLSIIVTKVRDELPLLEANTEEACRRLLRCHNAVLHSMLAPSSPQGHKKVILEMLTGMVTMSVQMAHEMLTTLPLREITINDLAKHPVQQNAEPNTTRAHFIRFVLAFFYHKTIQLTKQLLEHRNLLQSIIVAGMAKDEAPLAIVFLTELKVSIADNSTISKTTKLKVFNTKVMIKLLEIYTWTGPDLKKKKKNNQNFNHEVSEDMKDEVVSCVHQLMVFLCTNHKLGVAFVDPTIGLDKKNYNELVFSVIKAMDPFWNCREVRDLALKIVLGCPDLVAPAFKHLGQQEFFTPTVSLSFVNTCEFARLVVSSLEPARCLTLTTGTPDQLAHLTVRCVFNMNVVNCIRAGLSSVHPTLRLQAVTLLHSTCEALPRFTDTVRAHYAVTPGNYIQYKQTITDHITKYIGLEEELMVAWALGVNGDQSLLRVPTDTEYYLPFIDALLSYNQLFPVYLPPVFLTRLQTTSLNTVDTSAQQLFSIKLMKFIIMFKSVQPSQPEFNEMIKTLVPLLSKHTEARLVFKSLMLQTSYFEGIEHEIDIWMENLASFTKCNYHLELLHSVLKEVGSHPKRSLKLLEDANRGCDIVEKDEFDWQELIEVARNPLKSLAPVRKILPSTRLSILIPALLKVLNSNKNEDLCSCKFCSSLLSDIMFFQVDLTAYSYLIETCDSPKLSNIKQYISKWNTSEHADDILSCQPFSKRTPQYKILKYLSEDNTIDCEYFKSLSPDVILMLVRQVMFVAVRSSSPATLTRCSAAAEALIQQVSAIPSTHQACLEEVFLNPLVLQRFNPLEAHSSSNLTHLVLSLLHLAEQEYDWILDPFRKRFIGQLKKVIRKGKTIKSSHLLNLCNKLVKGNEEIILLLSTIIHSETGLNSWTSLCSQLLSKAAESRMLLPGEEVSCLSQALVLHNPLADYLNVFPHLIQFLPQDQIAAKQDSLSELASLLLKFDEDGSFQKKLVKNNKSDPAVVLPALSVAGLQVGSTLRRQVCQLIPDITQALCDGDTATPDWLAGSCSALAVFIASQDGPCREVFDCLSGSVQQWSDTHVDIARHVYVKLCRPVDFVLKALQVLVQLTVPESLKRAEAVCGHVAAVLTEVDTREHDWEPVRNAEDWGLWVRLALRLGETPDSEATFLLVTLRALCVAVYSGHTAGVDTVTGMVLSHSQFLAVMLAKPNTTKTALLELLVTLLQLDPSPMTFNHIPVFLSAYTASMTTSDQLLLKLLRMYENRGVSLSQWKPYLWGEAAVSFYSVKSQITPGLWNKQNLNRLLELLDEQRVNLTVANHPTGRALECAEVMEVPVSEVYDPAFYLPMLVSMFGPGEVIFTYKTCQSGALSLIVSALASAHTDIRFTAFVALQLFRDHLISNTNSQDSLWLHFVDALRRGLAGGEEVPRLSSVTAVFLARTALVLTNPTHPLYLPLTQYVIAKSSFSLNTVPELQPLFNSTDLVLHDTQREWILSVLRDGLRDSEDFAVCLKSMVFKIIMEFYSCTLASEKVKVLILEVLSAAVRVRIHNGLNAGLQLVNGYSLYAWLTAAVHQRAPTLTTALLGLLSALLGRWSAPRLTPLLLQLTESPSQLTHDQLTTLLAALAGHRLPPDTVQRLVTVTEAVTGDVFSHRNMLANGVKYVDKTTTDTTAHGYLKQIIFTTLEDKT